DVDTGALILTGVALQRDNARAIGELFADEAGRFVAVTAGDNLEAILAAHGSGAIDLSSNGRVVVNVDVGGGTTKGGVSADDRSGRARFVPTRVARLLQREPPKLLRTEPLTFRNDFDALTVSGGVS